MHALRITIITHILILLSISSAMGQSLKPRIANLTLDVVDDQVIIHYDLVGTFPDASHCISLFFSDINLTNKCHPTALHGDIGCDIKGGINKTVIWDISKDRQVVDLDLQCNILIDGVLGDGKTGGPANAALSLLIPGLGDYFVAERRQMAFKPWMRTTLALGFVGLGVLASEKRFREQRLIEGHWINQFDRFTGNYIQVWVPGRYINGALNYYLFKDDAEILIATGATIWLADILWVMNRGRRNQKALNMSPTAAQATISPFFSLSSGSFSAGFSLSL